MRRLVAALIEGDLRRTFRRIFWVGTVPALPEGPVVAYANHQSVHDGHLLWLLARRLLSREFLVWMQEADRFPFFALQGALPFPAGNARGRATTIRRTRRLLDVARGTMLAYFPEGTLHDADEAVNTIPDAPLERLHRALGHPTWWPVAIHQTWRGDARPVVLLTAGTPDDRPPTAAHRVLESLRDALRVRSPQEHVLLEGRPGLHERWDFGWAEGWFRHRRGR